MPSALHIAARRAFAKGEPAYAALQLRLMGQLMADFADLSVVAHRTETSVAALLSKVDALAASIADRAPRTFDLAPETQRAALSVTISDLAKGVRDCLRAHPLHPAARLLLESPSIPGDCEGDDRIRTVGDTRRFAVH